MFGECLESVFDFIERGGAQDGGHTDKTVFGAIENLVFKQMV